jgi:hypothetical protein
MEASGYLETMNTFGFQPALFAALALGVLSSIPVEAAAPVSITVAGQPAQSFAVLPGDPQWKRLNWLGFVSNADRKTFLYLDNLFLENKPAR